MSCGRLALERADIAVEAYYSSEIDIYAMKVADKNYPQDIIYKMGDVTKIDGVELRKEIEMLFDTKILLMGGSPCQGFSNAGKRKGSATSCGIDVTSLKQYLKLKEEGFEFEGQSYLFWEYERIRQELKPDYFMLENVRINKKWKPMFDITMGVEPIMINSALVSAQNRVRYYWTNIPNLTQPEDKGILLKDILESDEVDRDKSLVVTTRVAGATAKRYLEKSMHQMVIERPCDPKEFNEASVCHHAANATDLKGNESIKRVYADTGKAPTLTTMQGGHRQPKVLLTPKRVGTINKGSQGDRIYSPEGKSITLSAHSGGTAGSGNMLLSENLTYRKLTPVECARLQTVPDDYCNCVSNSQQYKMLGNGWTIDVIAHIIKGLKSVTS